LPYFSVSLKKFDAPMIKKLLLLLLFPCCWAVNAQTIKTDVLVIGGSPSGAAAAIQAARSKVKTILAAKDIQLPIGSEKVEIVENENIPSGIWGEFRHHVQDINKNSGTDTAYDSPLVFEKNTAEPILQKMADTVKNLTVDLNTSFTGIKKDGDRWEVHLLRDGKDLEIKARVVVDATADGAVLQSAGAKPDPSSHLAQTGSYQLLWYRTSIACGFFWPATSIHENSYYPFWSIPMAAVVVQGANNLLVTETDFRPMTDYLPGTMDEFLPVRLQLGQGAGAIAAYCAFFKTTTANLKVRVIQGELLDFKAFIMPFEDIRQSDPDWRAIQQVGATGLLKGESGKGGLLFKPDKPVLTAEIQPVLQEIYTRAFLWFNREKPGEKFTIGNTLSFISDYTLTDPAILKASVQKAWKTQFKFQSDFDSNRPITRREFAVLANKYLNPFARTVDLDGKLVN
jgi:hypothetical protein